MLPEARQEVRMRRHSSFQVAPAAVLAVLVAVLLAAALAAPASARSIHVHGRHLVDGRGRTVRLLGVNRSGAEYQCVQHSGAAGLFDGPAGPRSIRAMTRWHINAVRVPLNEDCWLGINGATKRFSGARYRHLVHRFVRRLHHAGLYVVLDLHWAAPGRRTARGILPMPDADHAPAYWRSVARSFKSDHAVLFDLYNEPHDIGWSCWLHGCRIPAGRVGSWHHPAYRAAGMQQLVAAVRSTGAKQPLMLGGLDWSRVLHGWAAHLPHDRRHQLVASEQTYGELAPCVHGCRRAITRTARHHPVVVGELGETDCADGYIHRFMPYADRHGISYLGWTWNATAPGSWTCRGGPSLIRHWSGTPTAYGVGFRNHLAALAARRGD
jgi:endoglucanase